MVKNQILKNSWRASLKEILLRLDNAQPLKKLAIVGIGNEFNGDDAAGILIVRKLALHHQNRKDILVIEAGQALENITGTLIRFTPDVVLFIDAVSIGLPPGSIQMVDWRSSSGFSASTHSLPLSMVIDYLQHEHKCMSYLLGIQIRDTEVGSPLSTAVKSAVLQVTKAINNDIQISNKQ